MHLPLFSPLLAVSALDGRYYKTAEMLSDCTSELALMNSRLRMQCEYFAHLSEAGLMVVDGKRRELILEEYEFLADLKLALKDGEAIKEIESPQDKSKTGVNHDVVALILWLRNKLKETSLGDAVEWVHFAGTSEDCNNIAYALMLRETVSVLYRSGLEPLLQALDEFSTQSSTIHMLARTHGQPASPTTLGKEFRIFHARLKKQVKKLRDFKISVKLTGASGNFNALLAAYPSLDVIEFSESFIERFNTGGGLLHFVPNTMTAQIEPHDTYAELFAILMRINTILIGLDQDLWRYVSDDWLGQKPKKGEVGSSAMPHKVNPIDLENSEGNLGFANAMLGFFCGKLPISRLQRDLSDSTVLRNFGLALGHCLIGYLSLLRGLKKISPNEPRIREDLLAHPEVVAEGIQTILRRAGYGEAYNLLKDLTRGKEIDAAILTQFIDSLDVPPELKDELRALSPDTYLGLACELARRDD